MIAGAYDYLLKIRVGSMAEFNHPHEAYIQSLSEVIESRSQVVLKTVSESHQIQLPQVIKGVANDCSNKT